MNRLLTIRKVFLLFLSLSYCCLWAQSPVVQDSSHNYLYYDKYLNQTFNDFKYNPVIDSMELTLRTKFENVISCLIILAIDSKGHVLNMRERNMILERLRELSEKFFHQGTPIVLLDSGMSSVGHAQRLNDEKKEKFLYVSLGDSCTRYGNWKKGIDVFNHSTRTLLKTK